MALKNPAGNLRPPGRFRDSQSATLAQPPKPGSYILRAITMRHGIAIGGSLAQHVLDPRHANLLHVPEILDPLQHLEVLWAIEPETSLAAHWRNQADNVPLPQS